MQRCWCLLVVVLSMLCAGAVAQETSSTVDIDHLVAESVQSAKTNQLSAERVLFAADQAIEAAAVIVSSVKNDLLIHTELKRLASGIPSARANIVIDASGALVHDSYKYPVAPLGLSDRTNFKEALTSTN